MLTNDTKYNKPRGVDQINVKRGRTGRQELSTFRGSRIPFRIAHLSLQIMTNFVERMIHSRFGRNHLIPSCEPV